MLQTSYYNKLSILVITTCISPIFIYILDITKELTNYTTLMINRILKSSLMLAVEITFILKLVLTLLFISDSVIINFFKVVSLIKLS